MHTVFPPIKRFLSLPFHFREWISVFIDDHFFFFYWVKLSYQMHCVSYLIQIGSLRYPPVKSSHCLHCNDAPFFLNIIQMTKRNSQKQKKIWYKSKKNGNNWGKKFVFQFSLTFPTNWITENCSRFSYCELTTVERKNKR